MKSTRTRHSAAFKAKVALAAVREHETVPEIARRHQIHANLVYKWKRELLDKLTRVFDREPGVRGSEQGLEREGELLKKIGELTVERDFLSAGLGRYR